MNDHLEVRARVHRLAVLLTLLLVPAALAGPQAVAVEKVGSCPSGYSTSGSYCLASSDDGTTSTTLPPQVMRKIGSCPSGYSSSGDYCKPGSSARFAVEKVGSCPSGYSTSGAYCLAGSGVSQHAIPKTGSCPSGYSTSGAYCLAGR